MYFKAENTAVGSAQSTTYVFHILHLLIQRIICPKTVQACISAALHANVDSYIKIDQTIIRSQPTMKILGFIFGSRPTIDAQFDAISLKFRRRVWILRHLKKSGVPTKDLIKLYQSLVLPVLDYTSIVYHSMLSNTQDQKLESLQKLALRIVYSTTTLSYDELLTKSGLTTLRERRICFIDNFLLKAINHPIYSKWFTLKVFTHHDLRKDNIYEEKYARTKCLYQSPLFYYRRRLNHISRVDYY